MARLRILSTGRDTCRPRCRGRERSVCAGMISEKLSLGVSMEEDISKTEVVKAILDDGTSISIQATSLGGEERVAFGVPPFKEVTDTVEGLAKALVTTLKKVKPRAASVEFGVQVGIESGKLTALLVKGTGNANLKITLECGEITEDLSRQRGSSYHDPTAVRASG